MTHPELKGLVEEQLKTRTQTSVAAQLGISPSALNQYLKDTYPSPHTVDARILEHFGGLTVNCPCSGEITLVDCANNRKRPFEACTNPAAVRLYRTCRSCSKNKGNKP